jgi:hypothetical protein
VGVAGEQRELPKAQRQLFTGNEWERKQSHRPKTSKRNQTFGFVYCENNNITTDAMTSLPMLVRFEVFITSTQINKE